MAHSLVKALGGLAFIGCTTAAAPAAIITFSGLQHGQVVNTQFQGSHGLTVSANNPNKPFDLAIIFDSEQNGTSDPDLEGPPWSNGNLAPGTVLGNMLIIAENNVDANGDGIMDDPDDEGAQPAGSLTFNFATAITDFGLDLVDVEDVATEPGSLQFFNNNVLVGTVSFSDFLNSSSPYFDSTIMFGDNSANRITPITAAGFGASQFNKVVINLGGSAAIDNLKFNFVPAPGVAAMLLGSMLAMKRRRR